MSEFKVGDLVKMKDDSSTWMDKCREAFERFECEKYEANYDDMKKNWDWYESQFGYRYSPDSLRGKDWAVWQKAWQHQQAKVDELQKQAENDSQLIQLLKKANKDLVIERDDLINKYNEYDKLLFQRNKDEQKLYDINEKHAAEKAELQKRVDAAIEAINEHYDSDGMSGLYFMDIKEILEGEQALKGEGND